MINQVLLNTIFNENKYYINIEENYVDLHPFKKAQLNIIIVSNHEYNSYTDTKYSKRKNCIVSKIKTITYLYINVNYINSIIRHKLITNILNNV